MAEQIKQTKEKILKKIDHDTLRRESYNEARLLLDQELVQQRAMSKHAADIALLYANDTEVISYTGRTRDDDDTVYYRTTPWLLNEEYSKDGTKVYFSLKNEGDELDTSVYSIINMMVENANGVRDSDWFATVGDAYVSAGFDESYKLDNFRGVALNGSAVVGENWRHQKIHELAWSNTDAFESVKDILNWMSVEYSKNTKA
ncbi:MAG TPA: hypothetical protein PK265_00160 [Candidatus Saccharibacteria bacterium]|nr:hypothetical protein [Candidatus Saccharibacteria bacterium]HRQ97726.1 hypothetical protein [Candidatus Saccharibacteria bacterium]